MLVLTALWVRTYIFQASVVEGKSMEPCFSEGDRLFVKRLSFFKEKPCRGDVVIFHPPGAEEEEYIKRVIAVSGDRVRIEDGEVIVNDIILEETYTTNHPTIAYSPESWIVPEGKIFVLGDNRNPGASMDSRAFGLVDEKNVLGIVVYRYWPWQNRGRILSPVLNLESGL